MNTVTESIVPSRAKKSGLKLHKSPLRTKERAHRRKQSKSLYWQHRGGVWWVGSEPFDDPEYKQTKNAVEKLCHKLLKLGGKRVYIPMDEPAIWDVIALHGQAFQGSDVELKPGRPSDCHGNCARLWKRHKKKYGIITGFAMMADQEWRRHSWLVDKLGNVIETTVPRQIYFGIGFEDKAAEMFCKVVGE